MVIDVTTFSLLASTLATSAARSLFKTIVSRRIAEKASLKTTSVSDEQLDALVNADLISLTPHGDKYFVTAKGLKVARDLEQIAVPD